ncbi:hypothetical protein AC623_13130 [Bacillus sp. FJAT-27231]|uniref:endolytic transglycosylase MltG n=1 Tax=Bacillus sp. FJAT-27231 TaxID=1679168 RepID=UPI0006715D9C|nr:endolytic transglycosylase MltG [Bacillus sp. FJAT-27231]KMY54759.1 hypothetical protein AC623_13130 [Bacillus sp. FJAT-27231]
MNKQSVRAFAFGLLAASLALFVYQEAAGANSTSLSKSAMIQKLEKEHYVVLTAKEDIQQKQEKEQLQQKLNRFTAKNDQNGSPKKEKTRQKNSYTLRIESGMSSSEVGRLLEKAGVIEDSEKFNTYLTDNGYAEKLQVGEHTVHPSMSMKEMAVVLTTK